MTIEELRNALKMSGEDGYECETIALITDVLGFHGLIDALPDDALRKIEQSQEGRNYGLLDYLEDYNEYGLKKG